MVKRIGKVLLAVGLSATLLTGCAKLPSPSALVTPPKTVGDQILAQPMPQTQEELMQTIRGLLPQGATLVQAGVSSSPGGTPILSQDLGGGEGPEIVVVFSRGPGDVGVMMLQLRDGKWQKVWQPEPKGYTVDLLTTADLTGDHQPELLLGWRIGASAGVVLEIYSWQGDGMKQLGDAMAYNKIIVTDVAGPAGPDGKDELAFWNKDTGDAFMVELFSWNGQKLVRVPELEPYYMPKVVAYYEERIAQSPDILPYWVYYADALERSQQWQKALDAANKGLELNAKLGSGGIYGERLSGIKDRAAKKLSGSS